VKEAFEIHKEFICGEVLATSFTFKEEVEGTEWDLNGEMVRIEL